MKFPAPLIPGRLILRYKRFLADIELEDGQIITAHCANPGSMLGLCTPGAEVWVSHATNPAAKLKYKWELIRVADTLVGLNTAAANRLAEEAVLQSKINGLRGYGNIRREVKYGENSRIDLLLSGHSTLPDCYVEVKSVTLRRDGPAEFPDSVTKRGTKHLHELKTMVSFGHRAMMLYVIQRADCTEFSVADDIDPAYGSALRSAMAAGVETRCHTCHITPQAIVMTREIPVRLAQLDE